VAGTSVERLIAAWTRSTFVMLWWIPNAPRKNQMVAKRNAQSQSCQDTTVRK
jgi:hypothetical protein